MPVSAPYSARDVSFLAALSDIHESSWLFVQLSISKQQLALQSRRWHSHDLRGHRLISKQLSSYSHSVRVSYIQQCHCMDSYGQQSNCRDTHSL